MRRRSREDGFTLVELAIVCVVIGILVGIAIPNYSRTKARAGRASCISNQRNIYAASTLYAMEQGIVDAAFDSETLFIAGAIPGGLTECPDSQNMDNDDYLITIEDGSVVDVECTIAPDEHVWAP